MTVCVIVGQALSAAPKQGLSLPGPDRPSREGTMERITETEESRPAAAGPETSSGETAAAVRRPVVLGVAGGSGSGKTTVVKRILEGLDPTSASLLHHDSYYRHHPDLTLEQRAAINYDHPDSLETSLLAEHLRVLLAGQAVEVPEYDFTVHRRLPETRRVEPRPLIIVDGILVLAEPELRELMDIRVFVDTDSDIRFIRRLGRDTKKRGRPDGRVRGPAVSADGQTHAPRVRRAEPTPCPHHRSRGRQERGGHRDARCAAAVPGSPGNLRPPGHSRPLNMDTGCL